MFFWQLIQLSGWFYWIAYTVLIWRNESRKTIKRKKWQFKFPRLPFNLDYTNSVWNHMYIFDSWIFVSLIFCFCLLSLYWRFFFRFLIDFIIQVVAEHGFKNSLVLKLVAKSFISFALLNFWKYISYLEFVQISKFINQQSIFTILRA